MGYYNGVIEAMGGKDAPLKIDFVGVTRDRVIGQTRGCRSCNHTLCDYGSNDLCYRAKNVRAMPQSARKEARAHMRMLNVAGLKWYPLWGGVRPEDDLPIIELKWQMLRIAKLLEKEVLEDAEEGDQVENGTEEAKDTILYVIDQIKSRNSKGGSRGTSTEPGKNQSRERKGEGGARGTMGKEAQHRSDRSESANEDLVILKGNIAATQSSK